MAGIAAATAALMAALWYLGVTAKQQELSRTEINTAQMRDKLKAAENVMRKGEEIAGELQARQQVLDKREATLAPERDVYAWIISVIQPFIQAGQAVKIEHYSQPEISDAGILPGFPYKWATFHLEATAYYHDFGKFFADLENSFPYFRIQNLNINVNSTAGIEPEKLSVTFELVTPVKTGDAK